MDADVFYEAPPRAPEIVVATLMRPTGGSGVQSHVRTFHQYAEKASRPVSVLTPYSSKSLLLFPVFGARLGIRHISRPASVWWYQHWHAHFLEQALRAHLARGSADAVVYAQCPLSAHVALRARTTQPVVMAAHFYVSQADEWATKGQIPRGGAMFRSIRSFEERTLGDVDAIVHVSDFTRVALEDRIPALHDIPGVVVPNSVPIGPAAHPPRLADLITVGALEPHKNHGYLLDVLGAASRRGYRYTLSVVGDGPDRARLEARTRRLGLTSQVRFLGFRPDPRSLMRAHRLYCHSSMMESFGIVLVEAMAEGLPVIAAAVGGVPEIIRPGIDGAFWPLDDAAAASEILIELMEDPARRAEMATAARERATTQFSTDVVGRRLLTFLEKSVVRR